VSETNLFLSCRNNVKAVFSFFRNNIHAESPNNTLLMAVIIDIVAIGAHTDTSDNVTQKIRIDQSIQDLNRIEGGLRLKIDDVFGCSERMLLLNEINNQPIVICYLFCCCCCCCISC
jgi:hypothetical protein